MGQQQLDSRAIEIAAAVQARQDHHEDECEKRYIRIEGQFDTVIARLREQDDHADEQREKLGMALTSSISEVKNTLIYGMGALIILLLSGVGAMIWDRLPHPH